MTGGVSAHSPLIDLHLHTTASDGRCTPRELVTRSAAAGVTVLAVTDHDTTDGVDEAVAAASPLGIVVVPGIEITAVENGRDVHMLGYFFDQHDGELGAFLTEQRATRVSRLGEIAARLAALGMPVDVGPVLVEAQRHTSKSLGRPLLARAMISAGYVADIREAFDKWLSPGCPAFVERTGASPEAVIAIVHRAGGLISLAHPGRTGIDSRIGALGEAGLDAIEVYHSDHDPAATTRYLGVARDMDLLVTGGSDFHGDPKHGLEPGTATLPEREWTRLFGARGRYGGR